MPNRVANVWSQTINGLSARLRVELEDLEPGLRHAVYLELRNESLDPVAVTNQPHVHAELVDESGKPVSTSGYAIGGPEAVPQWAVIPRDAYIGFRIDIQAVDVPTREQGTALVAVGGKAWKIGPGAYRLEIGLACKAETGAPDKQWVGELKLVPVEILLTPAMLAAN